MQRIAWTRSWIFYLVDMNTYTRNLPVCNSGQYIYVTDLCNFFFVLQELIDRINSSISGELASQWLLTLYVKSFSDENEQPSLEWRSVNL